MAGMSHPNQSFFMERRKGRNNDGYGRIVSTSLIEVNPPFAGTTPGTGAIKDFKYSKGYLAACYLNTYQLTRDFGNLSWGATQTATGMVATAGADFELRLEGNPYNTDPCGFILMGCEGGSQFNRTAKMFPDGSGYDLFESTATVTTRAFCGLFLENQKYFISSAGLFGTNNRIWVYNGFDTPPDFPFRTGPQANLQTAAVGTGQARQMIEGPYTAAGREIMVVGDGNNPGLRNSCVIWQTPMPFGAVWTATLRNYPADQQGNCYVARDVGRNITVVASRLNTTGFLHIHRSVDFGVTWSTVNTGLGCSDLRIYWMNGIFIILLMRTGILTEIYTSPDGTTFTLRNSITPNGALNVGAVTPNGLYIAGVSGVNTPRCFRFNFLLG